jgi:hypothetical protein
VSEFIERPFDDAWETFNREAFKQKLLAILDDFIDSDDEDESDEFMEELDTLIMGLIIMKEGKGKDLEVIPLRDIPLNILIEFGIDTADDDVMDNGYIPVNMLPEDILEEIELHNKKGKKSRKNNWLKDQ